MPLPSDYLQYKHRKTGMDHDLYPASNAFARKPVTWPNDAKVAVWITVAVEFFPLTPKKTPVKAPGHMVTPYPDLRTYTTRDYGNRVGIFRIMRALDASGAKATAFVNGAVPRRYPQLVREMTRRDWELAGFGMDMDDVLHSELDKQDEAQRIAQALDAVNAAGSAPISGWLSPGRFESPNTPHLLAQAGLSYVSDWSNDDLPYVMTTGGGDIISMPYAHDLEDRRNLVQLGHTEEAYEAEVIGAFDYLKAEAGRFGGRILHLPLTPYVIGQPFRIQSLKKILTYIRESGGAWFATGRDIVTTWKAQQ